jgi:hypothetical protein
MTASPGSARALALGALLSIGATLSHAETLVLAPSEDTTIFADGGDLAGGAGDLYFGNTANSLPRRALLRFDLSTIDPAFRITDASLQIVVSRVASGAPSRPVALHRVSASWGAAGSNPGSSGGGDQALAGDATWTTRFFGQSDAAWAEPGGDFEASASASTEFGGTGTYAWSGSGLVADLNAWLAAPSTNFGWIVIGDEVSSRGARRAYSVESDPAFLRPELTLTLAPIPEPSTYAMFGIGALLLAFGMHARRGR